MLKANYNIDNFCKKKNVRRRPIDPKIIDELVALVHESAHRHTHVTYRWHLFFFFNNALFYAWTIFETDGKVKTLYMRIREGKVLFSLHFLLSTGFHAEINAKHNN